MTTVCIELEDLKWLLEDLDWDNSDDWVSEFRDAAIRLSRKILSPNGKEPEERVLEDVEIEVNELISRFNFDMRVMMEFTRILVGPNSPYCPKLAEAVLSIQRGIIALVDHAGLEESPSVKDYMTNKIWGER